MSFILLWVLTAQPDTYRLAVGPAPMSCPAAIQAGGVQCGPAEYVQGYLITHDCQLVTRADEPRKLYTCRVHP